MCCTGAAPATRKGILAAQVAAAERLRASGETGSAWCSSPARSAAATARWPPIASRRSLAFLVNGEPTDNRLGSGHARRLSREAPRQRARRAFGLSGARRVGHREADRRLWRAARSNGRRIRSLGTTHYTVGLISGGVAPNVVPPHAEAEIMFRTVGDHDARARALQRAVGDRVTMTEVLEVPPVRLTTRRASRPRCSPTRPTSRCCRTGERRCCSARARFTWRTPITSTCERASCCDAVDAYERLARALLDDAVQARPPMTQHEPARRGGALPSRPLLSG